MTARLVLPPELGGLLCSDWELVIREACMDALDAGIVRHYIVGRLPQIDAAAEIGIDRKTISRRLPSIIARARQAAEKLKLA